MQAPIGIELHQLRHDLRALVENELDPDERLLWVNQPAPGVIARGSWGIVLFAIPWTAFSVFWICGAAGFEVPDFEEGFDWFPLFGIPFLLMGIGMLSSPLWAKRMARNTVYALTDRRALIFEGKLRGISIRSFPPDQLRDRERIQRTDGTGDLIFKKKIARHGDSESATQFAQVGFKGVADVKRVEDLIEVMIERRGE